jgi:hypothetical protein
MGQTNGPETQMGQTNGPKWEGPMGRPMGTTNGHLNPNGHQWDEQTPMGRKSFPFPLNKTSNRLKQSCFSRFFIAHYSKNLFFLLY